MGKYIFGAGCIFIGSLTPGPLAWMLPSIVVAGFVVSDIVKVLQS